MEFSYAIFNDFSAWAVFTCRHGCGVGDRADTKQIEMALVDVGYHEDAVTVGDPMQCIRDSRCLYGCGRSSISTGISRLKGNEVEVQMSCDACDGRWTEYYLIPEVAGA